MKRLVLLGFMLLASPALAATIGGFLLDDNGQPIPGATVSAGAVQDKLDEEGKRPIDHAFRVDLDFDDLCPFDFGGVEQDQGVGSGGRALELPLVLGHQRAGRALETARRIIGVDRDHQQVGLSPRIFQVPQVSDVEQVEAAAREDDALAPAPLVDSSPAPP